MSEQSEHPSRGSTNVRRLMELFPLPAGMDPPCYAEMKPGLNTLVLVRAGWLVYATDTSAAWLWEWMESGTFHHDMRPEQLRHLTAFHLALLPDVVAMSLDRGKQVLIV